MLGLILKKDGYTMKHTKKLAFLLTVLLLVASLTACGKTPKEKIKEASLNISKATSVTQGITAKFNMSSDAQDMESAMVTSILNSMTIKATAKTDVKNQLSDGVFTFSMNNVDYDFNFFVSPKEMIVQSPITQKYMKSEIDQEATGKMDAAKTTELQGKLMDAMMTSIDDKNIATASEEITLSNQEKLKADKYTISLDTDQGIKSLKAIMDLVYTDDYSKNLMIQNIMTESEALGQTITKEEATAQMDEMRKAMNSSFEDMKKEVNLSGSSISIFVADNYVRKMDWDLKMGMETDGQKANMGILMNFEMYDINKEIKLETPALTDENTQTSEEFMSELFGALMGL